MSPLRLYSFLLIFVAGPIVLTVVNRKRNADTLAVYHTQEFDVARNSLYSFQANDKCVPGHMLGEFL